MINAITHEWNKLHADYTAAHHEYIRLRLMRGGDLGEPQGLKDDSGLSAHLAAKGRLASAQRAMHEFCQQHAELA